MSDIPLRFMRRVAAAGSVSAKGRAALLEILSPPTTVSPATDLMVVGEKVTHGYVVEDGWGCRYRILRDGRRQIFNFILPGDHLGRSDHFLGNPDHSVTTLTRCRIYPFSLSTLMSLEGECPELRDIFHRSGRRDLLMLRERIVDLGRRNARERVARLILELYHRLHYVGLSKGLAFDLPLTQEALADALGLSIVHVNRTLRRLNAEGLIDYCPGRIAVQDWETLAGIAEFDVSAFDRAASSRAVSGAWPAHRYDSAA